MQHGRQLHPIIFNIYSCIRFDQLLLFFDTIEPNAAALVWYLHAIFLVTTYVPIAILKKLKSIWSFAWTMNN